MKKTTFGATVLLMVGFGALAQAQPPAAPPKEGDKAAKPAAEAAAPGHGAPMVPKPPAENDVIKKSVGTWSCEATGKGPDGQEMKYKSTWTVKPALGGHWFSIVYKRAKMGPQPAFEGNATVGYDVTQKQYTFVGFDNMGGWINLKSSDGAAYSGDGVPMGKVGPVKFTFTEGKNKKGEPSDKLFDMTMDFGVFNSAESCKK